MSSKQFEIPMPWGYVKGQIFGDETNKKSQPILALHGFLDNSNSFKPLASSLCKNDDHYIIAIDLPGQGLSSKLSNPLIINFKTYVFSIRKIVNHFKLKNFIFLCHSFGSTLGLLYTSCYPDDVSSIILLDFVFDYEVTCDDLSTSWRETIDRFIESEENENKTNSINSKNPNELTYEMALERLLKANRHVDEPSAKILLERSLTNENEKLQFSRDPAVPKYFSTRHHFKEFMNFRDSLTKNIKSSILFIYAYPYPFGKDIFDIITSLLNDIGKNSNVLIDMEKISGSHHFHMIQPNETSQIILNYIEMKKSAENNKISKL